MALLLLLCNSNTAAMQQFGNTDIEVSVGQYSPDFEKEVFYFKKKATYQSPFLTAYGYNILKLVQKIPAVFNASDLAAKGALQEKVEAG